VCALACALAGCPKEAGEDGLPPLALPASRLEREREKQLLELLDDIRGDEYLARVRAEEKIEEMVETSSLGEVASVAGYMVQLTTDRRLDVRTSAVRLLAMFGRDCPAAVRALVDSLGDSGLSAALRDDACRSLRHWTGNAFGYRAWGSEEEREEALARWQEWLDSTGGYVPPPQ
jgi:hypothetical protein